MSEQTKSKKLRLYKFAADYNLATDTLMDFLNEKGHNVKTIMTLLSDEMVSDINAKFKKEIEKAESHYKKIEDFHKKRTEKSGEDVKSIVTLEEEKVEKEEIKTAAEIEEDQVEETKDVNVLVENQKEDIEETVVEEIDQVENTEPKIDEVQEVISEEAIPVVDEPDKPYRTQAEIELHGKKKGLTIVGRVELQGNRRKDEKPKEIKTDVKTDGKPAKVEPAKDAVPATKESEADKLTKKKKKKLKAKKKEDTVDDTKVTKKKKKVKKFEVDKREVEETIKRTLLSIDETAAASADRASAKKKKRKEKQDTQDKIEEQKLLDQNKIKVTEYIAVNEIANLMNVSVSEVISKCISLGLMVSINQRLDVDTITLVADEFGFEVEFQEEYTADFLEDTPDKEETLAPRPPVVTIMGHVDHGKTSLLDYVRKANVVAGESGGITQHIGAYRVQVQDNKYITFLDTPGHEAFTAMRARGAKVTDIVVLIVAADDAVMPQTVEAINHAQAASVPIIVAINKIDKPNSNSEKIRQQLADRNILVEDWGGKYQCVEISAKAGLNIDLLLEKILLEADLLELRANYNRLARGTVVESQMEQGRGVTATVLVQKGTLKVGGSFVAGVQHGRVRAMFDERNNKVDEVGPSTPVLVLGFEGSPQAGDTFVIVESEREAREIAIKRQQLRREQENRQVKLMTLDEIANQISQGAVKELPIVVKGDVDGSVEALADSLMKLSNKEVAVNVIHKGVGAISEGDVLLAAASRAIIVGFHVRPHTNARKLAESEKVDIRLYNVIYDAINEVKSALEGMLSPVISEELVATVEIRETFKVPKIGTVAGCYVQEGKIARNNRIRLFRDGIIVYEGSLSTLKRFKDDVKEVDAGYECGLNINNFNDLKIGDIIEAYKLVETKKTLQ